MLKSLRLLTPYRQYRLFTTRLFFEIDRVKVYTSRGRSRGRCKSRCEGGCRCKSRCIGRSERYGRSDGWVGVGVDCVLDGVMDTVTEEVTVMEGVTVIEGVGVVVGVLVGVDVGEGVGGIGVPSKTTRKPTVENERLGVDGELVDINSELLASGDMPEPVTTAPLNHDVPLTMRNEVLAGRVFDHSLTLPARSLIP